MGSKGKLDVFLCKQGQFLLYFGSVAVGCHFVSFYALIYFAEMHCLGNRPSRTGRTGLCINYNAFIIYYSGLG